MQALKPGTVVHNDSDTITGFDRVAGRFFEGSTMDEWIKANVVSLIALLVVAVSFIGVWRVIQEGRDAG